MNSQQRKDCARQLQQLLDTPDFRCDAAESMFLARELETIRAGVFEVEYEPFKFRELLPINREMHPGDELFTYRVYDKTGAAKFVSDYATDFPPVDAFFTENSQGVKSVGDSYSYSVQELRAAMKAGRPLAQLKANMAREAIERAFDLAALLGDTTLGITGLFTFSGTETYTTPAGGSGLKDWPNKTPDEILADVHGMEGQVWENSKEIEMLDTLVLPTSRYRYIHTTKVGDGSGADTIAQHLLKNAMHIKRIMSSPKLESNSGWTGKRMAGYTARKDKLELLVPQEFEQFAPQARGMSFTTNCHARIGGCVLYKPKSVIYGDEI